MQKLVCYIVFSVGISVSGYVFSDQQKMQELYQQLHQIQMDQSKSNAEKREAALKIQEELKEEMRKAYSGTAHLAQSTTKAAPPFASQNTMAKVEPKPQVAGKNKYGSQ